MASEILHLHLSKLTESDPAVPGREVIPCWGWREGLADDVVFALNRWNWRIDAARTHTAGYAIFEAEKRIVLVAQVEGVTDGPEEGTHSIVGRVLTSGPVYDQWFGKPSPIARPSTQGVNWVSLQEA
ncbi:hypothetical protein [Streptacidiphilus sp. MAP5-3]|uniref:hypothetical protein n=1 Tax=unclassified Streptacidiphilus TaxID=2643834 RepID=UPI00351280E8